MAKKHRKILIATGIFPPDIGGPATYSKLLLDELPNRGLAVKVVSFGAVRHLPKIIRHFVYFFKILRKGFFADVIFAQDPVSVGLPSVLAAKILRKKFILKVVGDYAWEQYQQKIQNSKFKIQNYNAKLKNIEDFQAEKFDVITELRRKVERWVAKKAAKIIVPSEYLKKIVGTWGAENNKIIVVYNAFKNELISAAEGVSAAEKSYIVSAGRLVPWKGFDVLIDAIGELPEEIKLKIIGSGPERKKLELKIKNSGLENKIDLIGQLPHRELLQCFAGAEIFVLNTAYEGLSHVILEAMACGVPVITTNIGGNPEIIKNGHNGILVEYNNKDQFKKAISELHNNLDLRKLFIENSYKELEKFSKEKMLKETINILIS
jgi:glycosyltransferase involved in cell wall biosynthesis